jgi:hypothetical protein
MQNGTNHTDASRLPLNLADTMTDNKITTASDPNGVLTTDAQRNEPAKTTP